MAQKTVAQLKAGVAGLLSGVDLSDVVDQNNAIERAVRTLTQKVYIPEQMNPYFLTLYPNVYNYNAPSDIFGNMFVDLQPQGISRTALDMVYRQPVEVFDRLKLYTSLGYDVTFEYSAGVPTMRIAQRKANQSVLLDPMNEVSGWVVGGTASGLAEDDVVFYQSPSSLRFNLATGVGSLSITETYSQDLTSYIGVGKVFLAAYIPLAANLTQIELRIGSSPSNYYSVIATAAFLGAFQSNDFNSLIAFDLSTATKVGSPVITAMNFNEVLFTTTATINNMRVGQLFIGLGVPHKLLYQTDAVFVSNATKALSQTITSDQDTIILNDSAYNLLEHEAALTIALQNGGTLSSGRVSEINALLNGTRTRTGIVVTLGLYDLYRGANPSEEIKTVGNWYED